MKNDELLLSDFDYNLPSSLIAQSPLEKRDASRLLVYENGKVKHDQFFNISEYIPQNSSLVFNNTRVIPARIYLTKPTGASIEIFLLQPIYPSQEINLTMEANTKCTWQCMIGNAKKWKEGELTKELSSTLVRFNRTGKSEVEISWDSKQTFSEIMKEIGNIPLPPYINRKSDLQDQSRYQTVYSKIEGAVAAPTAGLHFTERTLADIKGQGHDIHEVTLHVGAGTFLPVSVEHIRDHQMHYEQVSISKKTLEAFASSSQVIPVGTTSFRTLESLFWFGALLHEKPNSEFLIHKNTSQEVASGQKLTRKESIEIILNWMEKNSMKRLEGSTGIFVYPGYKPKMSNGLITNFHLPKSTLIMLIAAVIGKNWRTIYEEAVENGYRFLSYGDSSLLLFEH